jgi:hypothetical protein
LARKGFEQLKKSAGEKVPWSKWAIIISRGLKILAYCLPQLRQLVSLASTGNPTLN